MSSFKSVGPYLDSFTHVKYVYYSYAKGKSTHIVKEFLLSESKNDIDFLAVINQQPQLFNKERQHVLFGNFNELFNIIHPNNSTKDHIVKKNHVWNVLKYW